MKKGNSKFIQLHYPPEDSIDFIRTMRGQVAQNDSNDKEREELLDVLEDIVTMLTIVADSIHCVEEEREREAAEMERFHSLGMMLANGKKNGVS